MATISPLSSSRYSPHVTSIFLPLAGSNTALLITWRRGEFVTNWLDELLFLRGERRQRQQPLRCIFTSLDGGPDQRVALNGQFTTLHFLPVSDNFFLALSRNDSDLLTLPQGRLFKLKF